jgi:DNA polymerase III alpha subunit
VIMNDVGQVVVDEDDIISAIYSGHDIKSAVTVRNTNWISKYNHLCTLFDIDDGIDFDAENLKSPDLYIESCLQQWHIPDEYENFDIEDWLLQMCNSQAERDRVTLEIEMFTGRNMIRVLKFLRYFIDTMRDNNVIWGVGRGSSVASHVLFLIGVHRINSFKYNLDIREFLK